MGALLPRPFGERAGVRGLQRWLQRSLCCLQASSAGISPRRARYLSLLRQRKVPKRKATPLPVSLRCASGNLRCSCLQWCCGTRFAQALRSDSRSKSDDDAWACSTAQAHCSHCASRHGQRGPRRDLCEHRAENETVRLCWHFSRTRTRTRIRPHPLRLRLRREACGVAAAPKDADAS